MMKESLMECYKLLVPSKKILSALHTDWLAKTNANDDCLETLIPDNLKFIPLKAMGMDD